MYKHSPHIRLSVDTLTAAQINLALAMDWGGGGIVFRLVDDVNFIRGAPNSYN